MLDAPSERASFFDRIRNRSPMFWLLVALMLGLNGLYDYYNPRGIVIDAIAAVVLIIAYFRYRSARR
jgi:mannitol-specific phosphotransferase system IIBC component